MQHQFVGKWITTNEFFDLMPRNVFHKQLEKVDLPCDEHRDRHILYRKKFTLSSDFKEAIAFVSADDYYKLYINGAFVAQGPAPSYNTNYNYNQIDVSKYLQTGENTLALHTLYQGLINRVWQSGDNRHGLIFDLVIDGKTTVASDQSFKTSPHTAYTETGVCGYDTQFLERYDSRSAEVGFATPDFDDSGWENAKISRFADHTLTMQKSGMLEFEQIASTQTVTEKGVLYDFGSNYVGYLHLTAKGKAGDRLIIRCGQELNDDGTLRYNMRANCTYEEEWILSDDESVLDWFDYKSFRYAEVIIPEGVTLGCAHLLARHYPFELKAKLNPDYAQSAELGAIWDLCVHSQRYGVQEVIQDCMDREKGFYLGDGCYTALTNMLLTGDDSMVRKLIDDAFYSAFISDTLVTCMDCSYMQEIAEFPLILIQLVWWHYNYTSDKEYLRQNYENIIALLNAYRRQYEADGLLRNLDKWCVVEWPQNFQHDYDVDIREGQICKEAHISINAYYIAAIRLANKMADALSLPDYRDEKPLVDAFASAFFDSEKGLFKDGEATDHISLVGNSFVYSFGIVDSADFNQKFLSLYQSHGISSLSFFCVFPVLMGFVRNGRADLIKQALLDEGAWRRILREGGTTTFEGWGKNTKWNTSLFHMTMSYAAVFMIDLDLKEIL